MHQWFVLLAFLGVVAAVAATGAIFEPGPWYEALAKPSWTPPPWVFPVAWTLLYLTIAVAGWLAWRARGLRGAPIAFSLYAAQLVLNAAWSWLFFGLHRMGWAFVDVVLLWGLILGTVIAFYRIRPLAGWLLVPYLVWVGFAAALNFTIWQSGTTYGSRMMSGY